MVKETSMSPGSTMGSSNIRTFLIVSCCSLSIFTFLWMVSQRDAVRTCIPLTSDTQPPQPLPTQPPPPPPPPPQPNIIIQVPGYNETDHTAWNYNWDMKAWDDPKMAEGVGTRTILLVRHGQYDFKTGRLTELGQQQANLTGQRLFAMNMPYVHIIHSPLIRAQETANLISNYLPGLKLIQDDILEEGGPIQPKPTVNYWSLPDRAYHVDGPRLEAAFRKHFYRADKSQKKQTFEILVGHGNIFKYFALRALQLPPEAWMRFFIGHASITRVNIFSDGVLNIDLLGETGFMPPGYVTF